MHYNLRDHVTFFKLLLFAKDNTDLKSRKRAKMAKHEIVN